MNRGRCDICVLQFHLNTAILKHNICYFYRYHSQNVLTDHINSVHNNIKPWKCRKCGKCFSRRNNWHDHEKKHTRGKLFLLLLSSSSSSFSFSSSSSSFSLSLSLSSLSSLSLIWTCTFDHITGGFEVKVHKSQGHIGQGQGH